MKKLFATGMGGCVGHYIYDELKKRDDLELTFLIRSPEKIKYDLSKINVIKDDFRNIKRHSSAIKEADYVIHLLADWGNEFGNFGETIDFFGCIDRDRIKKILYFSTASILGADNKPAPEALSCGTGYIRGKFKMRRYIDDSPLKDKITVLYPTWVLGGDAQHPYSHAYMALKDAQKWFRLMTLVTSDLKFHFIHAKDIAKICAYLLDNNSRDKDIVLGTKPISVQDIMDAVIKRFGYIRPFRFKLTKSLASFSAKLLDKKISPWDKYCLNTYDQVFNATEPADLGLKTSYPSAQSIIEDLFGRK
jgi:nucleoside-diphosphate-sugar epimerase